MRTVQSAMVAVVVCGQLLEAPRYFVPRLMTMVAASLSLFFFFFFFCKILSLPHSVSHAFLSAIFCDLCMQAKIEAQSKTLRVPPRMKRKGDPQTATPASTVIFDGRFCPSLHENGFHKNYATNMCIMLIVCCACARTIYTRLY